MQRGIPTSDLFRSTPGSRTKASASGHAARWRINGFPARIVIWTESEWNQLEARPTDAQYFPCGIWCALRMD